MEWLGRSRWIFDLSLKMYWSVCASLKMLDFLKIDTVLCISSSAPHCEYLTRFDSVQLEFGCSSSCLMSSKSRYWWI